MLSLPYSNLVLSNHVSHKLLQLLRWKVSKEEDLTNVRDSSTCFYVVLDHGQASYRKQWLGHIKGQWPKASA